MKAPHLDDYTALMEQKALRESYERAGFDAHGLGVPRKGNPYARPGCAAADQRRLQRLCEYWWAGWDHAAETLNSRRRTGSRPKVTAAAKPAAR
jgi:hypothetical protein